ncbi:hypothetical protein KIMC2_15910 [Xylocopilactobacillus apis]|uniref:Sensor histidine kinase NatK-like C-terminal domain-containing protein n=2 Tax=Xylocopilactobacillus apis TaxID=2932183 RepID=A0AAU9CSQ8_9LACO|nr:hypothetical protein KIMC2_15910 [Xylocopilactobacillus apis]
MGSQNAVIFKENSKNNAFKNAKFKDQKEFKVHFNPKNFNQFNFVFLAFVSFILLVAIYMSYELSKNRRHKRISTEKAMMENYVDTLEKMQLDIQKVQHDYQNMLMGINGYIEGDQVDVPELKEFLKKNQLMQNNVRIKTGTLNQLKRINLPAVKGLISTKVVQAVQLGINVSVECSEIIQIKKVDPFDLARALGIILDNAIEECRKQEKAEIKIAFIDDLERTLIVIANTCSKETLNVIPGKSTKGKNRGLGLQNLKEFVDGSNYLMLETGCSNYIFTQKLSIRK